MRTRVLELLLLQRAVQIATHGAQLGRDGRSAEVRAHGLWGTRVMRSRPAPRPYPAPRLPVPARAHVYDMQLGQQAAVSQRELVPVQKAAAGLPQLRLLRQLMLQRRAQVAVQPGERAQQLLVQGWGRRALSGPGPPRGAVRTGCEVRPPPPDSSLTVVLRRRGVLDERGELVEDVVARRAGL